MTEAAIFMSGNSQAVRLPKSFRFQGKSVEILRRGNDVVLREKRQTLAEVLQALPPVGVEDAEAFDQALTQARTEQAQTRDWDRLLGNSSKP
jgi:antitoxin VapB